MRLTRRQLLGQVGASAAVFAVAPTRTSFSHPSPSLRLAGGENAYGPSPRVVAALRSVNVVTITRYPDVAREALRRTIARAHDVAPEQVVLGCGSEEILRMAVDAFLGEGKGLVVADPTCSVIARFAEAAHAPIHAVPLTSAHAHDLDAMRALIKASTGLVYICNPNNPTGTLTRRADIESFVRRLPPTVHVVIDEAYHDYVDPAIDAGSFIDRPLDDGRVIVSRSFSKVHGLAGLRAGYAIASAQTAARLGARSLASGVGGMAALAAAAALDDPDHVRRSVRRNADDRQEFFNQANARMLRVIDSQANFVMLNAMRPAGPVVDHFTRHGVQLAPLVPRFSDYVRVVLGSRAQMAEFWRVWDLMPPLAGHRM